MLMNIYIDTCDSCARIYDTTNLSINTYTHEMWSVMVQSVQKQTVIAFSIFSRTLMFTNHYNNIIRRHAKAMESETKVAQFYF